MLVIVPFPIALEAVASKRIPILPILGLILRLERLLTLTPLIRRIISQSFGFTSICLLIESGSTSIFHLLFLLDETTSRNTVKVPS